MGYHDRVREIRNSFIMGYHDRETCISMFEELLHEHGLLPAEETLDRTITNESFIALLRAAQSQKEPNPKKSAEDFQSEIYGLAKSIKQRCPVCQKPSNGLYNRVQSLDSQVVPVDPPRCQECMMKWVAENFGVSSDAKRDTPVPTPMFSLDNTKPTPLNLTEMDFFKQYEEEMDGFKP